MNNIILIQKPTIDLDALKRGLYEANQQSIIKEVDSHYVKLTPIEESLVYAAYLYAEGVQNNDIQQILRNLPLACLRLHHYSFLIACNWECAFEIGIKTDLQVMGKHVVNAYLALVTGDLKQWYQAIESNVRLDTSSLSETKVVLSTIMDMLKLPVLFEKFNRKQIENITYLEDK